ncbi:putative peptidoglycan glycosyltransferase [Magnetofaba australis IT-1]|uniref:Putative peptidoglycan glycosyltransferase n=1 Tax=Magnetofaba australis IT-1 TaxID=1434232 RepID=A0A1Y2K9B3_9PROT|nr:putative peptidoglycan glycosyltransferase [Magnetofaba australis IT-1]
MIGLFGLSFLILTVRALDLFVLQGEMLGGRAKGQHQRKIAVPAERGLIEDRNGATLAISLPVKTLSVEMDRVENIAVLAKQLAPHLNVNWRILDERLRKYEGKKGAYPVIQREVPPSVARRIDGLNIPSVYFLPASKRVYPMGEVTAHILGFVNRDGVGKEGVESAFEKHLRGQPGSRLIVRDRLGRIMPGGRTIEPAQPGGDLVLSIDATVQYIAYRALLKAVDRFKAKAGSVVVMDPRNGQVLALVNQPSFNPNNLASSEPHHRRNRAVTDAYEPGSTFKVFTISAALDQGVVTPTTLINTENGRFRLADRTIRDFRSHKILSVAQVLHKSSNIGAAKIGLEMLKKGVSQEQYLYKFGFGSPTGIPLPYEASGKIPNIEHYQQVGQASRSYGYGITVTPLQLATAASAVVNGGLLFTPKLVLRRLIDGKLAPQVTEEPQQVLKAETSRAMRKILQGVVAPGGTAAKADVEGYVVAGKTGTARKAHNGGYKQGRFFSSFLGFVPADEPRLVIYTSIDEPQGRTYYGGQVAAPVFKEIAQEILPLLAVLPEQPKKLPPLPAISGYVFNPSRDIEEEKKGDDAPADNDAGALTDASLAQALEALEAKGIMPRVEGSGRVYAIEELNDGATVVKLR